MKRCIQIAEFGQGNTFPNQSVGCFIVMNGKILDEEITKEKFGSINKMANLVLERIEKDVG